MDTQHLELFSFFFSFHAASARQRDGLASIACLWLPSAATLIVPANIGRQAGASPFLAFSQGV